MAVFCRPAGVCAPPFCHGAGRRHEAGVSLPGGAVRALYGERINMTASRLERLRSCHFAYFMEYGLRAKPRQPAAFDAPQSWNLPPLPSGACDRGCAQAWWLCPSGGDGGWGADHHYIRRYMEQELRNFQGRGARFKYLFARLRNTAWAVVEQVAEEMRHSRFRAAGI